MALGPVKKGCHPGCLRRLSKAQCFLSNTKFATCQPLVDTQSTESGTNASQGATALRQPVGHHGAEVACCLFPHWGLLIPRGRQRGQSPAGPSHPEGWRISRPGCRGCAGKGEQRRCEAGAGGPGAGCLAAEGLGPP